MGADLSSGGLCSWLELENTICNCVAYSDFVFWLNMIKIITIFFIKHCMVSLLIYVQRL